MTPSTSPTAGGFIQGLQAEIMTLIGVIVAILVVRWLILRFVSKAQSVGGASTEEANPVRSFVNWTAGILFIIVLISFGWSAAIYGTNAIPHSDLDKSSIYQDMNSNIKR